MDNFI